MGRAAVAGRAAGLFKRSEKPSNGGGCERPRWASADGQQSPMASLGKSVARHPSERNSWGRLELRRACFATRMAPIASGCFEIPDMAAFQELMQADPSRDAKRPDGVRVDTAVFPRGGATRHRCDRGRR